MMLAAKLMDIITGIDVHIIQPPGPVPPVPIPHPFIGMVYDPMEFVPFIGASVYVNGMPRSQAGTEGKNVPPHIPMGGTFIKPAGNEAEVFMGSSTVLAEDEPFTFMGLPALSCTDIGMPAPPRPKKKGPPKTLFLPTSVVLPIPAGQTVLVGGAPTISLTAIAMKIAMGALMKGMKKLKKGKKAAKKADNAANNVPTKKCTKAGHPVDVATGKMFTEQTDFEIPGPIPLKWDTVYYSVSTYEGPIGYGWHHSYDMALWEERITQTIFVRMRDGRNTAFPFLLPGEESYDRANQIGLYRDDRGYYLRDKELLEYRFTEKGLGIKKQHQLESITNPGGQRICFEYNAFGYLARIVDSAGRLLTVEHDQDGKLTRILAPHPEHEGEQFAIVTYGYDRYGDLIEAKDALGHAMTFKYRNHLMLRETNRNGLSFYFEYDGEDHQAKCLHTWGDGGIYDTKLEYQMDAKVTVVENSLGHKTIYHWNNMGLVWKTVDPMGGIFTVKYNAHGEKIVETNELGLSTTYTYDERGNLTSMVRPDGASMRMQYDGDLLITVTDPVGGSWVWSYDKNRQLKSKLGPTGQATSYQYKNGLLNAVINASGGITKLDYDRENNITRVTTPDNGINAWNHDRLGRSFQKVDPRGNVEYRKFDLLGRITKITEPDGNKRFLKYDPEDNLTHIRDNFSDVRYEYSGRNSMVARIERGTKVNFQYNQEEILTGITNEQGHTYHFELDANFNITKEVGFDGLIREFVRDPAGKVIQIIRPQNQSTTFEYDLANRITGVKFSDGSEEKFVYRADGELLEAINDNVRVRFERDITGRVIKECQGNFVINSIYNEFGNRTRLTSSLGADLTFTRDQMGGVTELAASNSVTSWEASFQRDIYGLEMQRLLPGGIHSRWERDKFGRPVIHETTTAQGHTVNTRQYSWGIKDRLHRIVDDQQGTIIFDHDVFGNLNSAHFENGQTDYRVSNVVGSLFRTSDKSDRKYGAAGQLLESSKAIYEYDQEGNLIKKTEKSGEIWQYEWNASGNLKKVIRPDGDKVIFTYDALGRRIAKSYRNQLTYWVWDGNLPLHEWVEKNSNGEIKNLTNIDQNYRAIDLTTWIFEPESFSPIAKLKGDTQNSIITDHLGSPLTMYNENGEKTWQMELSIFGEVRQLDGWREACPFRYPGQYEDIETGLYYNRFRYYDADKGEYISQDPIGLRTGLLNLYSYVSDTNTWVDFLGLDCAKKILDDVGPLKGMKKSDIQDRLNKQGFSKAPAGNGGEIWTKAGSDGKTASIRLDPPMNRKKPKGFADEVPHAHKEIVPTSDVVNGNYPQGAATKYDDLGNVSSDPGATHIPIN